jgi:hypothetical protein
MIGISYTCIVDPSTFKGLIQMWTLVVCSKPNYVLWNDRKCLLGDYCNCGVDTFEVCPEEVQSNKLVSWRSIGYMKW